MRPSIPAVLALAIATAGCFAGSDAAITVSWTLSRNGAALTCADAGAASFAIDAKRRGRDVEYQEVVACDVFAVTFEGFRPGVYDVDIRLLDAEGNALSAPFSLELELFSGDFVDLGNFEFAFDHGRFAASWVITVNGEAKTCEDVGATVFQLTSDDGRDTYIDTFECAAMAAVTEDLPAGSWVVGIALLDAEGDMLNAIPVSQEVTLGPDETKNLGEFEFAFSFRDAFFRVHFGGEDVLGGNCQSTDPDGGAGVVRQEVRVTSPGDQQCMLHTVAGIYDESNELKTTPTCLPFRCQQEQVPMHLADLEIGEYEIQIIGYKQGVGDALRACYRSAPIAFTMSGEDIDLGLIRALPDDSMNPGACD